MRLSRSKSPAQPPVAHPVTETGGTGSKVPLPWPSNTETVPPPSPRTMAEIRARVSIEVAHCDSRCKTSHLNGRYGLKCAIFLSQVNRERSGGRPRNGRYVWGSRTIARSPSPSRLKSAVASAAASVSTGRSAVSWNVASPRPLRIKTPPLNRFKMATSRWVSPSKFPATTATGSRSAPITRSGAGINRPSPRPTRTESLAEVRKEEKKKGLQ